LEAAHAVHRVFGFAPAARVHTFFFFSHDLHYDQGKQKISKGQQKGMKRTTYRVNDHHLLHLVLGSGSTTARLLSRSLGCRLGRYNRRWGLEASAEGAAQSTRPGFFVLTRLFLNDRVVGLAAHYLVQGITNPSKGTEEVKHTRHRDEVAKPSSPISWVLEGTQIPPMVWQVCHSLQQTLYAALSKSYVSDAAS
jgi:hypothetical protein